MSAILTKKELSTLSRFIKEGNSDEDIQKEILSLAIQKSNAYLSLNSPKHDNVIPIDKYYEFLDSSFFIGSPLHTKEFHILATYVFLELGIIDLNDYHLLIKFFESPDNLRKSPHILTEIKKPVLVTLAAAGIGFACGITMENIPAGIAISEGAILLNLLTNYLTQDNTSPDLSSDQLIVYSLLSQGSYSEYELASRIAEIYPRNVSDILSELKEKGLVCAYDPMSSIKKWKIVKKKKM